MHVAYDVSSYTVPPEQRGYYELSTAIITEAIKDYRRICKYGINTKEYKRLRSFFLSDIFENISGCDNPSVFLIRLDAEIAKEIQSGERRKREKQTMKCNG